MSFLPRVTVCSRVRTGRCSRLERPQEKEGLCEDCLCFRKPPPVSKQNTNGSRKEKRTELLLTLWAGGLLAAAEGRDINRYGVCGEQRSNEEDSPPQKSGAKRLPAVPNAH